MNWRRVWHTAGMCFQLSGQKRAKYLKKHNILFHIGDHCMVMFRKIPLYPKLISMGDNVWIASGVSFITHDAIHHMLNYTYPDRNYQELVGCIDIKDNVFVGTNTTLLPNISIGPNTIVAAGSLVNKNLSSGVYAGVPAKYIGSFNDFVNKRLHTPGFELTKNHGELTDDTINTLWKQMKDEGERNNEQ